MIVLFAVGVLCVVGQTHFGTTQQSNLITHTIKTRGIAGFHSVHFLSATGLCVWL